MILSVVCCELVVMCCLSGVGLRLLCVVWCLDVVVCCLLCGVC